MTHTHAMKVIRAAPARRAATRSEVIHPSQKPHDASGNRQLQGELKAVTQHLSGGTIQRLHDRIPNGVPPHYDKDELAEPFIQQKMAEGRSVALPSAGTVSAGSSGQNTLAEAPQSVRDVLRSPGQPLDTATRQFMEPRFGHDFSRVRVHSDSQASDSALAVNALAYTVGHNIVFANGQQADTTQGRRLLAHELAHVVQQEEGVAGEGANDSALERAANSEADAAMSANLASKRLLPSSAGGTQRLQRQVDTTADMTAATTANPPQLAFNVDVKLTDDGDATNFQYINMTATNVPQGSQDIQGTWRGASVFVPSSGGGFLWQANPSPHAFVFDGPDTHSGNVVLGLLSFGNANGGLPTTGAKGDGSVINPVTPANFQGDIHWEVT